MRCSCCSLVSANFTCISFGKITLLNIIFVNLTSEFGFSSVLTKHVISAFWLCRTESGGGGKQPNTFTQVLYST